MEIQHQADRQRFVAPLQGGEAELAYTEHGGKVLDLQHTYVPREHRGDGIAEALVREAVDHARQRGMRVAASCPFVVGWFERNPDERSILADG